MGMNLMGSCCSFDQQAAAPNANVFTVNYAQQIGKYTLAIIDYPGCTNFNGIKICVYRASKQQVMEATSLDPHFDEKGFAPVARFEPTTLGWELACLMVVAEELAGRSKR